MTTPWWKSPSSIGAIALAVSAIGIDLVLGSRGGAVPEITLFMGRFHPLAVHLPIGVLMLVVMAEGLSLWKPARDKIDPLTTVALPVLVLTAVAAFALGHLLAGGGGFPPKLVTLHRRFTLIGVVGTAICLLVWTIYDKRRDAASRWGYRAVLGATMGILTYGAHHGGSMTRGEGYLTKYAPEPIRKLLEGDEATAKKSGDDEPAPPSSEPLVYADVVAPILKSKCVECHGAEQVKGGLKLDDFAAIQKGGDNGPAVVAGNAEKSSLYARMILPVDNEERMPPEGKPGPSPEEIALIKWWIERGASDTLKVRDALAPEASRSILEKTLSGTPQTADASPEPPSTAAPVASGEPTADPGASNGGIEPAPVIPISTNVSSDAPAYDHLVAPVLVARCGKCHGPAKQKGKLRVDSLEAVLQGGKEGPAVIAGNPGASPLVSRVKLPLDDDKHMPPKKEPQLTDAELALVSWWIEKGATKDIKVAAVPANLKVRAPKASPPGVSPLPTSTGAPPVSTGNPPTVAAKFAPPPGPPPKALPDELHVFQDAVHPILKKKCGDCHSEPQLSGELDVTTEAALFKGGQAGRAIVPGQPDKSLLLSRVYLPLDDTDHMPPENQPQMTAEEVAVVRWWIATGAKTDQMIKTAGLAPDVGKAIGSSLVSAAADAPAPQPSAGTAGTGGAGEGGGADGSGPPSDGSDPPPDGGAPEPQGPPPERSGGCASCTAGRGGSALFALPFALGLGALLGRRARRRPTPRRPDASLPR